MTHPLTLVIICAKYGNNSYKTARDAERTRLDVTYFSSLNAKWQPNDFEGNGESQMSLRATHPLMIVIICGKYGKNPSRTVCAVGRTRQYVTYFSSFIANSWLNDLEYVGQRERSLCATHPLMIVSIYAQWRTDWNQYKYIYLHNYLFPHTFYIFK